MRNITMLLLTSLMLIIFQYGCAGMGIYIVGKSFLNKKRANVYVTDDINYINKNKCVFVKYISSSTSWGGATRRSPWESY